LPNEIKVNLLHALENYLDMYSHGREEIVVIESIANSLDEDATRLDIHLFTKGTDYFYSIVDNAGGMDKKTFDNYHTVALSNKVKGKGIGFAGVGAKIYLAAWSGSEIVTETNNGETSYGSKMYRKGDSLLYDVIDCKLSSKGTSYTVKLSKDHYSQLQDHIEEYIIYWFNFVLDRVRITVNNKRILPWKPEGVVKRVSSVFHASRSRIPFECWLTEKEIPEDRRHLEFVCYGKRILVEKPDWLWQVDNQYHEKFAAVFFVDSLSAHLTSNKEGFQKNWFTNKVLSEAKSLLYKWLKDNGAIIAPQHTQSLDNRLLTNYLTTQIDKLLSQKEWKWLNPWLSPPRKDVLLPSKEGEFLVSQDEGSQAAFGNKGGEGSGSDTKVSGPGNNGDGYTESNEGDPAKPVERKAKGIAIIPVDWPEDPREGFIDPENKGIAFNIGHPFAQIMYKKGTYMYEYNLCRVIIGEIIKHAAKSREMSAEEALETYSKVIHGLDLWN
jgi:hypothetical protein